MDFQRHQIRRRRARRSVASLAVIAGFLTLTVGFLTLPASADDLDDALERLDRLEAQRGELQAEADTLGSLDFTLPGGSDAEKKRALREGERLAEVLREIELEILLARQACRSLVNAELETLGRPSTTEGFARESRLLDLLEGRLSDGWNVGLILVEPDSLDGYETLIDKQACLEDFQEQITGLIVSSDRRIESMRRERALLLESERFADDANFLDEGDRVGSDEIVALRGVPGEEYSEGSGRISPSGHGVEDRGDLRSMAPTTGSSTQGGLASLTSARAQLEQDLSRVEAALEATEALLGRYATDQP